MQTQRVSPCDPKADGTSVFNVAKAAKELHALRERWLHPPEWIDQFNEPGWPTLHIPKLGYESDARKLTLTNLYNEKPRWLANIQRELDMAVAVAYGWSDYTVDMSADAILARLFKLNLARAEDLFASPDKYLGEVITCGRRTPKSARKGPKEVVVECLGSAKIA